MLKASAQVNHTLLQLEQTEVALTDALRLIGEATAVDRVYVFELFREENEEKLLCSQISEWSGPNIEPQIENEVLQRFPIEDSFPRWIQELKQGNSINGLVRDLPSNEHGVLADQGIQSILVVPITIRGALWGFVGFDNCTSEYEWISQEIFTLTSLAANIGLAIERKRTLLELEESFEKQKQINRLKDHLITTLSHEVRSPLTAIELNTRLLDSQLQHLTGKPQSSFCSRIKTASDRILHLLDQALFVGGSATDAYVPEYGAVELEKEVSSLVASMADSELREREVVLSFDLPNKNVSTDWAILRKVLFNLLDNAAKYSERDSQIKLALLATEEALVITVQDYGCGIATSELRKITEPFYRVETSAVIDGAGLGLTEVSKAVASLGGQLSINSTPGHGSVFKVNLLRPN